MVTREPVKFRQPDTTRRVGDAQLQQCTALKLKLIKSYLRSSIAQDRLDSLALMSIENEAARQLDLDTLVDKFANIKAREKEF